MGKILNRKQFIQSYGATCKNWTWSWSFINHDLQMVIFGAWDSEHEQGRAVILRKEWEFSAKNIRQSGYSQAIEHLQYIHQGYDLYTFNMVHSPSPENRDVAVIKDFERRLEKRWLQKEGDVWYADVIDHTYPDEITFPEEYTEGTRKVITVNAYERNPEARRACISHHGTICKGCGFDFEKTYGEHGKGFIHIHHIRPLGTIGENYGVDPKEDMVPLCPNCHAMVHRGNATSPLSVDELRNLIEEAKARQVSFMSS
ncbi:HNH endonuclease [Trabulsiella odontotermitis]|uniref:HNH endonuclease n=1 Tax=Trabulsiella odontotermitis TaxID=379893 RepID=UPI00092D15DD|nr:HNH endonuclease [Trabulsiella odontotermitis]